MKFKSTLENYLFVLPAVIIFGVFYIIPFFWVLKFSFFDWDGIVPFKDALFVNIGNFKEIVFEDKIWWKSFANAGYITLIALTLQNILAFLLALACDRQIRLKNFYRLIFFIPPVLSEVVVGLVWQWILDGNYGLLNGWLAHLGLGAFAHNWLSDHKKALNAVALDRKSVV